MKKITILVPCYREEKTLHPLYEELTRVISQIDSYQWELLFVNDGSPDGTLAVLKGLRDKDPRVNIVDLSRNFGKEAAMLAGFDFATGDAVIILDADLQDPPSLIPEMIAKWEEGYDDVYAKRKSRGAESWLRRKFSLAFYSMLQRSARFDVLENVGDFRLLDRSCINVLKQLRESERYTKGMFCWIGFRKYELLFDRQDRVAGESAWNFFSLLDLAIEGITSFTTTPLRISTIIGSLISLWAFIYMIFIFFKTIFYGDDVQGFPTILIAILFLGGIQLLSIGILGEYIGRIFNETKSRPTYVVREYNEEKQNR
ncbi:MAG: glycosyltransferase family 2 protein [Rikenellaceae bacterium]